VGNAPTRGYFTSRGGLPILRVYAKKERKGHKLLQGGDLKTTPTKHGGRSENSNFPAKQKKVCYLTQSKKGKKKMEGERN